MYVKMGGKQPNPKLKPLAISPVISPGLFTK